MPSGPILLCEKNVSGGKDYDKRREDVDTSGCGSRNEERRSGYQKSEGRSSFPDATGA